MRSSARARSATRRRPAPGRRPDRQRSLGALRPPEPTGDPAGSVTFSAKRAAHLHEQILEEAEVDDRRPTGSRRLEQDYIGPPVEAGVPHHDAGQPAQLAADHRAQPRPAVTNIRVMPGCTVLSRLTGLGPAARR